MNKRGSYKKKLVNLSPRQWEFFLKKHSNLPGPEINSELAKAFTHVGTLMDFKKYIQLDHKEAPENTPAEFLTFCGVLGVGQYLANYHDSGLLLKLMNRANDPRKRIREAVSIALRAIGRKEITRLLKYARKSTEGSYMEQRAVIAALCEPALLDSREVCLEILELLDWMTASMIEQEGEKEEGFRLLEKTLSYCWSITVEACPEKGKPMMERWIKEKHHVINRIMKENLKNRLSKIEPEWAEQWLQKISG